MTTNSTPQISKDDGRLRPYVISLDWLQFSVHLTQHFVPEGTNCWGYTTKRREMGSKVWKDIYDVFDEDGVQIGQLACHPHSSSIRPESGVLKFDNDLLYEANAIDRAYAAVKYLGLDYKGITRLDIAYDCNELFNGLKVDTLIKGYIAGKYCKRGQNKWMLVGDSGYYGVQAHDRDDLLLYNRKPDFLKTEAEKKAECKRQAEQKEKAKGTSCVMPADEPLTLLEQVPSYLIGSLTWGFRSNAIQVQVYDKSKELRDVKFKQHIWQTWINSGLDVTRPVYRIEIRIQNQGKHVINLQNGEAFVLSAVDVMTQEQLEQLFFDYAEKYFCFHHVPVNADFRHKERFPRLQVLSLCHRPVMRPKRTAFSKDSTRATKIALNQINKEIVANAQAENEITAPLKEVRDYLARTYELHEQQKKWMQEDLVKLSLTSERYKEITPEQYFEIRLQGAPDALAKRAAEQELKLEQEIARLARLKALESNDFRASAFAENPLFRFAASPSVKELIAKREMLSDARDFVMPELPPPPTPF